MCVCVAFTCMYLSIRIIWRVYVATTTSRTFVSPSTELNAHELARCCIQCLFGRQKNRKLGGKQRAHDLIPVLGLTLIVNKRTHDTHWVFFFFDYSRLRLIMPRIIKPAAYYNHFGLVRIFMKCKKPDITGQTSVIKATWELIFQIFRAKYNTHLSKISNFFK